MNPKTRTQIDSLIANPEKLLRKKPFTRGTSSFYTQEYAEEVYTTDKYRPSLPDFRKKVISQDVYLSELDPMAHKIIFDKNLPYICVKLEDGSYRTIELLRMPLAFQERIREKKTLTVCGNKCELTLRNNNPSLQDLQNAAIIREAWVDRNQDGMRTKAVYTQLGMGEAALLYYMNRNNEIKSRLLSYTDGYVLISHNDENGDRMLECVYYVDDNNMPTIDCYDDEYITRLVQTPEGWNTEKRVKHGFPEIPIVSKRGEVAWENGQALIESYEVLYNIFLVIQKRHGWGILYIKGNIDETFRTLNGSVILKDNSLADDKSDVQFKTPPSPQGMLETLQSIYEQIQIQTSTTFILPKDVKTGGDISGLAIMLTQELDIEGATKLIIDYQNFANKMIRLFKFGLAVELTQKGINPTAVTDFDKLNMACQFKIWKPFSETEYNNMLSAMKSAGILSRKTAVERNTIAQPDELMRIVEEEGNNAFKPQQHNTTDNTIDNP